MPDPIVNSNPAASAQSAPAAGAATPPTNADPSKGTTTDPKASPAPNVGLEGAKLDGKPILGSEPEKTPESKAAEDAAKKAAEKAERQKNMTPEQKAADDAKEADAAKAAEVPADGKYEFKFPDGVGLPKESLEAVSKLCQELGLSRGEAQKGAEAIMPIIKQATDSQAQGYIDSWKAQAKANEEKIKNHPEYGGAKLEESKAYATRAIRAYANPALIKKLDEGLGNDPDLFEFCLKAGKRASEDGSVQVTPESGTPQRPEDRMFGAAVKAIEQSKK